MREAEPLPIASSLAELRQRLAAHPRLVLVAPPGAGKTTQVPLALLDAEWLAGRRILLLEPRRIAARAAADFMARQLGEAVGATVGYRIRFESRVSAETRIEVLTEGILTRRIQADPELADVGAILFDEFHERHLHGDLGAALALDVQASLRPDLRLLILSATLNTERIARWFDAPVLTSGGRSFPVEIDYRPARADEDWRFHLRRIVVDALAAVAGDVLVFLPGRREIEQAHRVLSAATFSQTVEIVRLHGELGLAEQRAALLPAAAGRRRIVLATNLAESSLTLPGVRAVVDLGLAREPRYDPNSGFTRLETVPITQDSADQRAGRAGRLGPGVAYRLWPRSRRLASERRAEILQTELSALALELAVWGSDRLPWLDPPPTGALASARDLLVLLGALDEQGHVQDVGRAMLETGTAPRLAALVLRAPTPWRALACDLIALLEARDPCAGTEARSDDFRVRLAALHSWRRERGAPGSAEALAAIDRAAAAWRKRFAIRASPQAVEPLGVGNLLLHAFPDRVARQDESAPRRYRLSNGRGAYLAEGSHLYGEPWLVVADLRYAERDSEILAAAPFDPQLLERDFAKCCTRERKVQWNATSRRVEAFEEYRFAALGLRRIRVPVCPAEALPSLCNAVRELGLDALPWNETARRLRTRVACLREWCPELELPDLGDAALLARLDDWLGTVLAGETGLDTLSAERLSAALTIQLDHRQRRAVDEHAPEALIVPSGRQRRLDYNLGQSPVLAVKLQELFGLGDTPRIAKGRVPVTLHLLSPAERPIQVTQDLRGFWERTYPLVRKELKGRYPRHPWPEDPWSAVPSHRVKPRGR
jgi:ATP-dependent helicase HrpB